MGVVIHSHPVYDSDEHYTIDPISRNITNVKSKKTSLIQYDHNSERFSFDIPRYVEGHDMTLCNKVEIHYLNLDSMKRERRVGVYEVEDLMVTTEDDQVAVFTWLISQNCTELAGSLSYIIMFACVEDGETTYRWHTAINASIIIAKGMNNEEAITAPLEFPDILQQWKEELFTKDWAYESAKSHGFEGTAEEWLASLHGAEVHAKGITTTGSGAAYTANVSGITSLTAGVSFIMIPHTASTSQTATLNVNSLGAKTLRRPLSGSNSATTAPDTTNWLTANKPIRVTYDGTYWVVDMPKPDVTDLYGEVASGPKAVTITLASGSWSSNTQTVTVNGILADETKQLIQVNPASASRTAYISAGIICSGQAANSLTFTCTTTPTSNLTVYVTYQEVT